MSVIKFLHNNNVITSGARRFAWYLEITRWSNVFVEVKGMSSEEASQQYDGVDRGWGSLVLAS